MTLQCQVSKHHGTYQMGNGNTDAAESLAKLAYGESVAVETRGNGGVVTFELLACEGP